MADEKVTFTLDLDAKEFIEQALAAKATIAELGESGSMAALISGFAEAGIALGAIGVALLAAKTSIDVIGEAEGIKQVNKQFETLAGSVGIVGTELKENLLAAAGGMATETELIGAANKAIVQLGGGAEKLPELFELSRKAAILFGGDATAKLEELTRAIANGSQRHLKSLGIYVNVTAAHKAYAAEIGVAAAALSDQEKKQALLNEVLGNGSTKLRAINTDGDRSIVLWKQLSVTFSTTWEVFALAFEKFAGPTLIKFLKMTKDTMDGVKTLITSAFGEGSEKGAAQLTVMKSKLLDLRVELNQLEKARAGALSAGDIERAKVYTEGIEAQKVKMAELKTHIDGTAKSTKELQATEKEHSEQLAKAGGGAGGGEDNTKKLALETKFQEDLLKLQQTYVKGQENLADNLLAVDKATQDKAGIYYEEAVAKKLKIQESANYTESQKKQLIAEVDKGMVLKEMELDEERLKKKQAMLQKEMGLVDDMDKFDELIEARRSLAIQELHLQKEAIALNEALSTEQKNAQIEMAEKMHAMKMNETYSASSAQRMQILDRETQHAQTDAAAFATGFANASKKAQMSLADFGAHGTQMAGMLTNNMITAFEAMGKGSESGSEIMKGFFYGMIGDIAIAYGSMMIAAGLWPPNPLALVGGSALLALGAFAKSQAHGGSMSPGYTGTGAGGGGGGGVGMQMPGVTANQSAMVADNAVATKSTHIEINGNIYETDESRRRLLEMIREASDSTDVSYQKIGGGLYGK